jgi:hypothetical protein
MEGAQQWRRKADKARQGPQLLLSTLGCQSPALCSSVPFVVVPFCADCQLRHAAGKYRRLPTMSISTPSRFAEPLARKLTTVLWILDAKQFFFETFPWPMNWQDPRKPTCRPSPALFAQASNAGNRSCVMQSIIQISLALICALNDLPCR